MRFGDYFHEIPEPEIFPLPCGGFVSSECLINSLGLSYVVEVIPRQAMIDIMAQKCQHHDVALGFRIAEQAGDGKAMIYIEPSGAVQKFKLAEIEADSLPVVRQKAA